MLLRCIATTIVAVTLTALLATARGTAVARQLVQDASCESLLDDGATTIDFDDHPTGDLLAEQYRDDGIRFIGASAVIDEPANTLAHSGRRAARSQQADLGSAGRPIRMEFTRPMHAVAMFVGSDSDGSRQLRARLSAYGLDSSGTTAVVASVELTLLSTPAFSQCLIARAPQGMTILSAVLEYGTTSGVSAYEPRWLDDLTLLPADMDAGGLGPPPASSIEPG